MRFRCFAGAAENSDQTWDMPCWSACDKDSRFCRWVSIYISLCQANVPIEDSPSLAHQPSSDIWNLADVCSSTLYWDPSYLGPVIMPRSLWVGGLGERIVRGCVSPGKGQPFDQPICSMLREQSVDHCHRVVHRNYPEMEVRQPQLAPLAPFPASGALAS